MILYFCCIFRYKETECVGVCDIYVRKSNSHINQIHIAESFRPQQASLHTIGVNFLSFMSEIPRLTVHTRWSKSCRLQTFILLIGYFRKRFAPELRNIAARLIFRIAECEHNDKFKAVVFAAAGI